MNCIQIDRNELVVYAIAKRILAIHGLQCDAHFVITPLVSHTSNCPIVFARDWTPYIIYDLSFEKNNHKLMASYMIIYKNTNLALLLLELQATIYW